MCVFLFCWKAEYPIFGRNCLAGRGEGEIFGAYGRFWCPNFRSKLRQIDSFDINSFMFGKIDLQLVWWWYTSCKPCFYLPIFKFRCLKFSRGIDRCVPSLGLCGKEKILTNGYVIIDFCVWLCIFTRICWF